MLTEESGAVLVWVVLLIPVLVLLASFAVDLSSFFVHKRELQIKADAAALAGAGSLAEQIEANAGCDIGTINDAVIEYGKDRNQLSSLGSDARDGTTAESRVPPPSLNAEPDLTGDPCTDSVVDVTVREENVPWFFQIGRTLDEIKARARVEIQTIGSQVGVVPLGIPLPPDDASVTVRDSGTGATLATAPLTKLPDADPAGRTLFSASFADVPITTNATVDVTLSGSTIPDVGYIRGWETPDSTAQDPPELGQVRLETNSASCPADSFGRPYYFSSQVGCTVGVNAQIDWNSGVSNAEIANQRVYAVAGGSDYALTYDSATQRWRRTAQDIPVPAAAGGAGITIRYEQQNGFVGGTGNNARCPRNACNGTFSGLAARPYSANGDTLGRFEIGGTDDTGATYLSGLNTVERGTSPNLTFTVGITSNISLGGGVRTLRATGTNQTGGINCEGYTGTWASSFVQGCETPYQINERGDLCDPVLDPLDCLDPRTGNAPDVDSGLSLRIGKGATCAPNDYPGVDGDPRLVPLALVDFGSFDGSGGGTGDQVPVRGFAWFYITGWTDNQGNTSNCPGDEYPAGTHAPREIFGRYVKRFDNTSPGQIGNGSKCKFTDIYGCIAVVTH